MHLDVYIEDTILITSKATQKGWKMAALSALDVCGFQEVDHDAWLTPARIHQANWVNSVKPIYWSVT